MASSSSMVASSKNSEGLSLSSEYNNTETTPLGSSYFQRLFLVKNWFDEKGCRLHFWQRKLVCLQSCLWCSYTWHLQEFPLFNSYLFWRVTASDIPVLKRIGERVSRKKNPSGYQDGLKPLKRKFLTKKLWRRLMRGWGDLTNLILMLKINVAISSSKGKRSGLLSVTTSTGLSLSPFK